MVLIKVKLTGGDRAVFINCDQVVLVTERASTLWVNAGGDASFELDYPSIEAFAEHARSPENRFVV